MKKKNKEYKKIVLWIQKNEHWEHAMKMIHERTGLYVNNIEIDVRFSEHGGIHAGMGFGRNGRGVVVLNLAQMAHVMKPANEINIQTTRAVVTHELTHVYIGNRFHAFRGGPFWLIEGLCEYAGANLANMLIQRSRLMSVDMEHTLSLSYGRGRAFYEYLAKTYGKEKVKQIIALMGNGGGYKTAVTSICKERWEVLVAKERAWSAEWIRQWKAKFPGLQIGPSR